MSRPKRRDEQVVLDAAKHSLDEFREWVNNPSASDADLLRDLCAAIRYNDDGYDRAKELERAGYDPDSQLVELLEGVDLWGAESRAVAEWVKQFDVKPPFPVGTIVEIESATGEITANDEKQGQSTVFVESKGHVRTGIGTHGLIIAWEKLKPRSGVGSQGPHSG